MKKSDLKTLISEIIKEIDGAPLPLNEILLPNRVKPKEEYKLARNLAIKNYTAKDLIIYLSRHGGKNTIMVYDEMK